MIKKESYFLTFDASGKTTGLGFTPDGTIPKNGVACEKSEAQNWQSFKVDLSGATPIKQPTTPPALSLSSQARKLIKEGLTISVNGSINLTATFSTESHHFLKLMAIATVISGTGKFPGGSDTFPIVDKGGVSHMLTVSQFMEINSKISEFIILCEQVIDGNSQKLPQNAIKTTI